MPRLSLPEENAPRVEVRYRNAETRRHGGMWKAAYADFATALMALFIVLWLMNASPKVKASVGEYFHDPKAANARGARPVASSPEAAVLGKDTMGEIRKQIEDAFKAMPEFEHLRDNVKLSATSEGLRIELLENEQGMFFVSGSPEPTAAGERLLRVLAAQLAKLPNRLAIEGHTDATPFRNAGPTTGYSNWELASDRANAARRLLHGYGVRPEQVGEVRGFADQQLYNEKDRFDPRNRRVSVVVRFTA